MKKVSQQQTPWKKSRKFGDIHGGRIRKKLSDNTFKSYHSLQAPVATDDLPIYLVDAVSREFYFPITIEEIKEVLKKLPPEHTKYVTHIWLAKVKKADYFEHKKPQATFICGGGVYLIKLFAVPKDNRMFLGKTKLSNKQLNFYKPYCDNLKYEKGNWLLQWTSENLKRYFLERLILHEIGHCVDYLYYRRWSKANNKQIEDFADNYAKMW